VAVFSVQNTQCGSRYVLFHHMVCHELLTAAMLCGLTSIFIALFSSFSLIALRALLSHCSNLLPWNICRINMPESQMPSWINPVSLTRIVITVAGDR
jgi:hypothetical protein